MVPRGGFPNLQVNNAQTFKSMKTEVLFKEREEEIKKNNVDEQFEEARLHIQQFNQLKKMVQSFTFFQGEKKVLVSPIIFHILEEVRLDRKINMVLKDKDVETYISADITDIDLEKVDIDDLEEFSEEFRPILREKLLYRRDLAHKAGITKLHYFFKMLKQVTHQASMPQPENYADKLRQLQKTVAVAGVQRGKTNQSFFSMVSKTNMSSKKSFLTEDKSDAGPTDSEF
mmetsp:Transcript_12344/g.19174  ORF Transcript_12344/g.19174 Transcript_12344/m.19174 type:complete len:229 (-) Transcript_12344:244-930(-)